MAPKEVMIAEAPAGLSLNSELSCSAASFSSEALSSSFAASAELGSPAVSDYCSASCASYVSPTLVGASSDSPEDAGGS